MGTGRRTRGNGLAALRRERSHFAALALLLLLAQLLLSGLSQGAMAAERLRPSDLSLICHTSGEGNAVRPVGAPLEPERSCPCLGGVCLVSAAAFVSADAGAPVGRVSPSRGEPPSRRWAEAPSMRPPFDLFARASRGPPSPIRNA